ncbi:MAG: hypothetical protein JWQ87_2039 [Candidatus Sulfotelmatobacter sp.]|nr:hypothetical protein [Candidatus Sulfotelmatobacter sp.]
MGIYLNKEERKRFNEMLENDPEMRAAYEAYKAQTSEEMDALTIGDRPGYFIDSFQRKYAKARAGSSL